MTRQMMENDSRYLTIEELSQRSRLSVSTLHRLKKSGKIPYVQPAGKGGRLLFPADALERVALATASFGPEPPVEAQSPKRLSGPLPAWMQRPSMNNPI
jgi:excisionase family DNA binding protein